MPDLSYDTRAASLEWYYRIETEPGKFTPGKDRPNLSVCRKFFDRIDVRGKRVLDIGTQEFVAPTLFKHAGAGEIVAYDRFSLLDQLALMKSIYNIDPIYAHGMPLNDLKGWLKTNGVNPVFDVVNFSGVLYHMIDPLAGVAMVRSLLREGGIMILETSVNTRDDYTGDGNNRGTLYGGSNYFQPSARLLDYWCRMVRMELLDCVWFGGGDIKRIVMVLRATNEIVAEKQDAWIRSNFIEMDFLPYGLRYDELTSSEAPVVYNPLEGFDEPARVKAAPNYIDAYRTVKARKFARDPDLANLKLAHVGLG